MGFLFSTLLLAPTVGLAGENSPSVKGLNSYYTLDNDPTIDQPGRWTDITNSWHYESYPSSYNGDNRATSIPGSVAQYYLYTGNLAGAVVGLQAYLYSPTATGRATYEFLAANGQVAAITHLDQNGALAGWNYLNRTDDLGRRDRTVLVRHLAGGIVADAIQLNLYSNRKTNKVSMNMAADKLEVVDKLINSNKNYKTVEVSFDTTRDKGTSNSTITAKNSNEPGNHKTEVSITPENGDTQFRVLDNGNYSEAKQDKNTKALTTTYSAHLQQREPNNSKLSPEDLFIINESDGTVGFDASLDTNQLAESKTVIFPVDLMASYLRDTTKWNIAGSEDILGRDTWKITGDLNELQSQKDASDTFTVNIDKATGMMLDMKTYKGNNVVNKVKVNTFKVE